ncbi:MAG: RsmD family RNA methyltransferase [Alphaproteobacteria bacterium]
MRVISGTLKGRVIPTLKTHDYRPTLSRIREDVFNLIQHNNELNVNLAESTFGDLFCGTGSMGIEALSRGAQKVIFNDLSIQNLNTLKIFLKNIPNDNYEIHQTDIFKHSESLIENCNIIYVDPPYNYDFNLFKINILPKLSKNCLVIYESNQNIPNENLVFSKNYKNKKILFFRNN